MLFHLWSNELQLILTSFTNLPWLNWPEKSSLGIFRASLFLLLFSSAVYYYYASVFRYDGFFALSSFISFIKNFGYLGPVMLTAIFSGVHLNAAGFENDVRKMSDQSHIEDELQYLVQSRLAATVLLVLGLSFTAADIVFQSQGEVLNTLSRIGIVFFGVFTYTVIASFFALAIKQIRFLCRLINITKIDILNLDHLLSVANPFFRILGFIVLIFCLTIPAFVRFPDNPILVQVWYPLFLASFILAFFAYGTPLFLLRNRIRVHKEDELTKISDVYSGSKKAYSELRLLEIVPEARPDLVTSERRVRDTWEWPFAAHWERIVLFILLPPITWILAAIVENVISKFM